MSETWFGREISFCEDLGALPDLKSVSTHDRKIMRYLSAFLTESGAFAGTLLPRFQL
jgi:hypothetical protein